MYRYVNVHLKHNINHLNLELILLCHSKKKAQRKADEIEVELLKDQFENQRKLYEYRLQQERDAYELQIAALEQHKDVSLEARYC